jgi:uncharacterized protein (DUF2252 family)
VVTATADIPSQRPSVAEREARGKAARSECPRSSHGPWSAPRRRRDPVKLLEEQAASRVAELVPIRYGRMAASPFAFFRGGAYVMASDLATTPRTGFDVQLCGDAHLSNFGAFGAPDRRLVFDLNDFDETLPGPWEWDVKRLVASFVIAARERGFDDSIRATVTEAAARRYREAMREFAAMRDLEVWYARLDVEAEMEEASRYVSAKARRQAARNLAKTRRKDSMRAFSKLTTQQDGQLRLISDPPLIVPLRDLFSHLDAAEAAGTVDRILSDYKATLPAAVRHLMDGYGYVDAARKVVGVGSVGTRAYIALLTGRDDRDPLFLQIKEAQPSVLEPFTAPSRFETAGQRVVEGQRLMQAAGDIALGWIHGVGMDGAERDFYVRQLWDWKGSALIDAMEPRAMEVYAHLCGWTLARAHARSGDRVAIAAYLGSGKTFDRAMVEFAETYADQNELDHGAFASAIESGRLEAQEGI